MKNWLYRNREIKVFAFIAAVTMVWLKYHNG